MVEGVVYLPTELQAPRLALERDILEDREVPVVRARIAEDVFRRVPEIASRGARKRRRIDPLHEAGGGDFPLIAREIRIADDDDAPAIPAAGDVRAGVNQRVARAGRQTVGADAARRAAGKCG